MYIEKAVLDPKKGPFDLAERHSKGIMDIVRSEEPVAYFKERQVARIALNLHKKPQNREAYQRQKDRYFGNYLSFLARDLIAQGANDGVECAVDYEDRHFDRQVWKIRLDNLVDQRHYNFRLETHDRYTAIFLKVS